jgi:hypothetical protein
MKRKKLAYLIVVNVVLLAMLAMISAIPSAEAQNKRRRGDYMLIASKVSGSNSIVYVYDTVNRDLMALTFRQGKLTVLAPARNINNDLDKLERGRK